MNVPILTDKMSARDIGDVIRLLNPNDSHELFHAINIEERDIATEKENANSTDPNIQARAVFNFWIRKEASKATRQAILDALLKCCNIEAKEILEDIWAGKGTS